MTEMVKKFKLLIIIAFSLFTEARILFVQLIFIKVSSTLGICNTGFDPIKLRNYDKIGLQALTMKYLK